MTKKRSLGAPNQDAADSGEFLLYTTEGGATKLEVRLVGETVWLSQRQMSDLFQKDVRTISEHIRNVFSERELVEDPVIRKFRITAADGKSYEVVHYNLDVIISVGYRVKSHRGVQFRIWATQRLRDYLIKGFVLNDERFKRAGGGIYFDELLARIRDIRSSEKTFWRKVLDIYATSIDYDPNTEASQRFFATVQNKMHWAAHGHTVAEIVLKRADALQQNMGLTAWDGERPRKADTAIAKNYLNAEELETLNRIVTIYLEFAELQAFSRRAMTMSNWIAKLDEFVRVSEREVLNHAGKASHEEALKKAEIEFEKYRQVLLNEASPVERHFELAVKTLKMLERERPAIEGKSRRRKK